MSKIAIIAIIVVIIAAGLYMEFQRSGNLSGVSKKLALQFNDGPQTVPSELAAEQFDLLQQGDRPLRNWMSGVYQGYQVALFDFSYDAPVGYEGFGQHPVADDQISLENRSQSVVWIKSKRTLPEFDVSPANGHLRKVAARFGLQTLSLEGDPAFSGEFTLLVKDQERARVVFDAPLREALKGSGMVIESRGDSLLFYRFGRRLKAKELEGLLVEAVKLMALLK